MRVNQLLGMGACFAMLALTGCMDKDVYDPGKDPTVLKPESEYFDFTTTTNVAFEVNYGEIGSNALIEIFTEYPISYNETGSFVIQGEPVYKIFADTKGRFVGDVELPTAAKVVYVFSPTWGVPMCVEASVENGKVTVNETDAASRAVVATRAKSNLKLVTVNNAQKVYSLVEISDSYGKPGDINGLIEYNKVISSKFINNVQKALWKGKSSKPDKLNNSNYVRDTEHVNTTIAKAYQNEQGQIVTVADAELFFTFLTESCWYQNVVGYYYYKTGECPAAPDQVKKIVIFPNASIKGNVPYLNWYDKVPGGATNYGSRNAPLETNRKVQLLFQDDQGNLGYSDPSVDASIDESKLISKDYRIEVTFWRRFQQKNNNTGVLGNIVTVYPAAGGNSQENWGYIRKFIDPQGINNRTNENDMPRLRLSDMYLIRAEALNELGKYTEACQAIDMVRERARKANGTERAYPKYIGSDRPDNIGRTLTKQEFRWLVFMERGLEFAGEQKRWFDLIRMKYDENTQMYDYIKDTFIPSRPAADVQKQGVMAARKKYFPIPFAEVSRNDGVQQNPGY